MTIRPTPWTAAAAGVLAAFAWPLLWDRFGGAAGDGGVGLVVGSLLAIALPAHALVLGFGRAGKPVGASTRGLDTALLVRIAAWTAAAAATTLLRSALLPGPSLV